MKIKILTTVFSLFFFANIFAQEDRFIAIKQQIDSLAKSVDALNDSVTISVNGISFQDFIRAIAVADGVNINVDPNIRLTVVNNFTDVMFKDVLFFLIKEYNLNIEVIGNIISLSEYKLPPPVIVPPKPKQVFINYNEANQLLSMDLRNDSLMNVTRKITMLTGTNISIPELYDVKVSCYVKDLSVQKAIEQLAISNNLAMEVTKDKVIILSKAEEVKSSDRSSKSSARRSGRTSKDDTDEASEGNFEIKQYTSGAFSIKAVSMPLDSIVSRLCTMSKKNYYLISDFEGEKTLNLENISFEDALNHIFQGTEYAVKLYKGIYLIGKSDENDIKITELVQLQYRSVDAMEEFIPANIKDKLEIIEFPELNGFLVSGDELMVENFKQFILQVDKLVPVVLIEIMIVDVKDFTNRTTGLKVGKGNVPEGANTLLPKFDVVLDGKIINKSLESIFGVFTGPSWLNLGRVGEDFYIQMSAMEESGKIRIRSTPKLSTLNGHEATLTTGETRYYAEEQSSLISTQTIYQDNRKIYKSVNADFTITIKPFVSGDDYITLDVDVSQSDFVDPYIDGAPPGSVNRSFKSMVRVKNQELILLGGLDKNSSTNSGEGIPFLSKIPILKWFFSSRTKNVNDQELSILIKPTIVN